MPILNYTTSISCEKTSVEIQKKLVKIGANAVLVEYGDDKEMSAMSFKIDNIAFRLPINIDGVLSLLKVNPKVPKRLKCKTQASRVAWRIIKDWIEAQIAIIQAGQADIKEVFLPYMQNKDGNTLYNSLKESNFKLIT
jgi:hypothetical protein